MTRNISSVVDIPLGSKDKDKLKMKSFEMALTEFIKHTETPITIALQGEWGSGKTSLLNRLEEELCSNDKSEFYGIWINTWHYSLINKGENLLVGIIESLLEQIIKISKKEHPEKLKSLIKDVYKVGKNIFYGLSKVAVKTAVSKVNEDAANAVSDTFFTDGGEESYDLHDLKIKLSELIKENIRKNQEKNIQRRGFIFFIDDLDRIDPEIAVIILELMKNIFDINNCIFVLAIDYEVVVKGLKAKFGELNSKNEREFRSFFDKIIQLPFRMPVGSYVVDDYLKEMLLSVQILSEKEAESQELIKSYTTLTNLSIGTNPRSIKRLINTVSFINILIKSQNTLSLRNIDLQPYEKQLIFALLCMQTGFPEVYNLFADNSDLENWTDDFAQKHELKITDLPIKIKEELVEKWKQIIYCLCLNSNYLRRHFHNIIMLVEKMYNIAEENARNLHDILPEVVELLSVTNIKEISKPKIEINNIRVLYALNKKLKPVLKQKLCAPLKIVERKGRMIAKLQYKFDEAKTNNWISITVFVQQNNIYLKLGNNIELFNLAENELDSFKNMANIGKTEIFNQYVADFTDLNKKHTSFNFSNKPRNGLFVKNKKQYFEQYFQTSTQNIELFYTSSFIDILAKFTIDFMLQSYKMVGADWKPK